jgi:D-alanyl-D-alanine carboxypeptidase
MLGSSTLPRSFVPPSLVALALAAGCGSDTTALDAPEPPAVADRCSDLQASSEAGELRSGTRYRGENGFSFELRDAAAQQSALRTCAEIEGALDELVAAGVPGATIDFNAPGYRLTAARGLADKAAGRAMDADGLFRVASVAKTYVGALGALLALEQRIDLDDADGAHALADYLPETVDQVQFAERITLRELFMHTSGIPDYFADRGPEWFEVFFAAHDQGRTVTEDDALAVVYGQPGLFEPGSSASYCNTAYVLAARSMSEVLGHPYQDELRARFFEPLGLHDTYSEKHDVFALERLAHGYRDASEIGRDFDDWFDVDQGYGFANGGIVASARDVGDFFRAIPGGRGSLPGVDLPRLLELQRPAGPGYGLGLISDGRCYAHRGTFTGYSSSAFHCDDSETTGVVFANSTEPAHEALVDELVAQLEEW